MSRSKTLWTKNVQKTKKSATQTKLPQWYQFVSYLLAGVFLIVLLVSWLRPSAEFTADISSDASRSTPQAVPRQGASSPTPTPGIVDGAGDANGAGDASGLDGIGSLDGFVTINDIEIPQEAVRSAIAAVYALLDGNKDGIVMYEGSVFPEVYVTYSDPEVTGPVNALSQNADSYTLSFDVDPDAAGPEYTVTRTVTVIRQGILWAYFP